MPAFLFSPAKDCFDGVYSCFLGLVSSIACFHCQTTMLNFVSLIEPVWHKTGAYYACSEGLRGMWLGAYQCKDDPFYASASNLDGL